MKTKKCSLYLYECIKCKKVQTSLSDKEECCGERMVVVQEYKGELLEVDKISEDKQQENILMKDIDKMTKDEKNLLLYFETCLVDNTGHICGARMNKDDFNIAEKWNAEKFISFGRIPFHEIQNKPGGFPNTNWVQFTEDAWVIAHQLRKERSERMIKKLNEKQP